MDKPSVLALLAVHVLVISLKVVHGTTISLCTQTTYPELCNSFIKNKPQASLDETIFSMRDTALRATMANAVQAHKLVSVMDVSLFNEQGKSAWADCLELYEDTIDKLNSSITSVNNRTTMADSQTWLSAAIVNEQTCRNGFIDFDLCSYLQSFPIMLSDFNMFLSNSLALNKAMASRSTAISSKKVRGRCLLSGGFPGWVSAADRKLLQAAGASINANVVVAQDGSVYKENVEIKKTMKNLMFIGDGIGATIVTGNKYNNLQDGTSTFRSATFAVSGNGFIARDMTFENTAGPQKHQAVALRSSSDFSVFYSCRFIGYQDTLYVHSQRQFYRNCDICGTEDFICGDAVMVLQNCNIYVRRPMSNQKNTVTAQARSDPNENTRIVIHNSVVTAASDLKPVQESFKTYLGRPWGQYSRTVIMKSSLDSLIDPEGWCPWDGDFALKTLYYGEYMNTGLGAMTSARVKWPGYNIITSGTEAEKFSVGSFLAGDAWIPATEVPFTSGL
ncbi:unnamed protein product [Ilex paraguariensis]|uniref:Pectinesterase inhibitor domain-containing protein n=1 Tax=Ilex paraguariensis TaxID=185542 RepID=A0ABC8SSM5_9AQUA